MQRSPPGRPPAGPGEPESAHAPEGEALVERIVNELELLNRNVEILQRLAAGPPLGIIRLSEAMRLPVHKVRYSLHLLEREGVIQPSADGAVVTDRSQLFWANLSRSLQRMSELIQELRTQAQEHQSPPAGRKG